MKHRKALFVSIWTIALGIVLWISGQIIGGYGIIYHAGDWWNPSRYELIWAFRLVVGLVSFGVVVLILGVFGLITTAMKEYLDREPKSP